MNPVTVHGMAGVYPPPHATPYEILPDANYSHRSLRVFAALHPEYGAFDGERLQLTPKGRLALLLGIARRDHESPTLLETLPGDDRIFENGASRPLLDLAFEKIYDLRRHELVAREMQIRKRGYKDGRLFTAEGPVTIADEIAGHVAIGGPNPHLGAMFIHLHGAVSDFVMEHILETDIAAYRYGGHTFLEEEGLTTDEFHLSHPDLYPYMEGFLEGIAVTWREYMNYETRKNGKESECAVKFGITASVMMSRGSRARS